MSRAFRLGAFIVAALLIFASGVYWIGSKQFMFRSTYRLNAAFQNVVGLIPGAEVRVGGIHEGTVKHIDLPQRPDDKVLVEMDMAGHTRSVIRKDSVASVKSEGLVGDKFVEISFGTDKAAKISSDDTIQGQPPLEISDLFKKANGILDSASGAVENIGNTANNLASISSRINQGKGTLGALINDRKVYQSVNAGATAFQEDMEALKHNFFLRGFFKQRGYQDAAELKKHEISELPQQPVTQKFVYEAGKLFDKPDTAKLKDGKALKDAGEYLEGNQFGIAVVAAYNDMKGDSEQARLLTEARAMVARDYLVKNFKLDDMRIRTIGLGKSKEADKPGVEILVYPPGTNIAEMRNRSPVKP